MMEDDKLKNMTKEELIDELNKTYAAILRGEHPKYAIMQLRQELKKRLELEKRHD